MTVGLTVNFKLFFLFNLHSQTKRCKYFIILFFRCPTTHAVVGLFADVSPDELCCAGGRLLRGSRQRSQVLQRIKRSAGPEADSRGVFDVLQDNYYDIWSVHHVVYTAA